MKFEAEDREFAKFVKITKTLYSNFERHEQFLKQNVPTGGFSDLIIRIIRIQIGKNNWFRNM